MTVKLISLKCPECGALLSIEENRSTAFCTYCGAKVIVNNENEIIQKNVNVDVARIRESDNEKEIRLKELDIVKDSISTSRFNTKLFFPIGAVCVIAVILLFFKEHDFNPGMMFLLLFGILLMIIPYADAEEKREEARKDAARRRVDKYNSENVTRKKALPPGCSGDFSNSRYTDVEYLFREAGFRNIMLNAIEKRLLAKERDGIVQNVTISGSEEYDPETEFFEDAPVRITYLKKK